MCVCSAGRNQAPLADAFPDPAGRHPASPAVPPGLSHGVRRPRGVVLWHELAVVRHEVALQLFHVLKGQRQEELHAAEDVQQRLRSADRNSHTSAVLRGRGHQPLTCSFFGSALSASFVFPLLWTFSLFFTCVQTTHTHTSRPGHMTGGGGGCHVTIFVPSWHWEPPGQGGGAEISPLSALRDLCCL